eukprot:759986-Hanusia_phi.AAC.2
MAALSQSPSSWSRSSLPPPGIPFSADLELLLWQEHTLHRRGKRKMRSRRSNINQHMIQRRRVIEMGTETGTRSKLRDWMRTKTRTMARELLNRQAYGQHTDRTTIISMISIISSINNLPSSSWKSRFARRRTILRASVSSGSENTRYFSRICTPSHRNILRRLGMFLGI